MMSVNAIKYKGELLAEDTALLAKPVGTLGEYKELRADALEADTLDLTVVSESGTIRGFRKNDKVEYFRDGRRVGIYYLQSVTRAGPKLYTLSALSAVGLLIARPHRGGIYTGETVAEVVAEICGGVPVLVETIYRGIKLYGWLPIASARDNLVQVLFAVGAWLHTDENGTLRVQKLWSGTASTIGAGRVHAANIQVKYLDPVSAVAVTEHQYVKGTEDVTLFEGTAQQGDLIEFDAPAHTLTAEGFTILESGDNYAVLSAGTGKLTGKSYIHNMRVVTRTVTAGAAENVEEIKDATLVSLVNSSAVAQRMAAYYACREQLTVDVAPAAERAGHVVSLWSEWDKQLTLACIASRETRISGLLKSRTTALVGFIPPQPETSEYYDERVVLTGSGTWTVPEGITEIRAVLIGGGQGGCAGNPGADGTDRTVSWTETNIIEMSYTMYSYGPKAKGGLGGTPGAGGKVFVKALAVTSGALFVYSCGVGSAGSNSITDPASGGTDTTFGGLSSVGGSSSVVGYTDPVTGETFAASGEQGIAGGDGGGSSDIEEYPNPGGSNPGYFEIGKGLSDGGAVTDESGTKWGAGEWIKSTSAPNIIRGYSHTVVGNAGGDISTNYGQAECSFGCPGGAAAGGTAGAISDNGGCSARRIYGDDGTTITGIRLYAKGGSGGKGADALAVPLKPTAYGKGGRGGYGGGGGGAPGVAITGNTKMTITLDKTMLHGTPGVGGLGSAGGEGADGCIIIYYRRPKPIQPGWVKDKNGKPLLERLNKRLIV